MSRSALHMLGELLKKFLVLICKVILMILAVCMELLGKLLYKVADLIKQKIK